MPYENKRTWDFPPQFHVLPKVFDKTECDTAISYHEDREHMEALAKTGGESYRNTDLFWLNYNHPPYHWLYDRLYDVSMEFNEKHYQFDIEECSDLQLARYGSNQHYDWHTDIGADGYSRRKLSIAVMMSDPKEFDGGALQFGGGKFTHSAPVTQGDGVLFPSWIRHRVEPVTRGERWTLVGWWLGPPFR